MIAIKCNEGEVIISELSGDENRIVAEIAAVTNKVLLTTANTNATSAEEVYEHYGRLTKQMIEIIEASARRLNVLIKEK